MSCRRRGPARGSISWTARPTASTTRRTDSGPAGAAIRTGDRVLVPNVGTDPAALAWRERHLAHGFHSVGSFPFRIRGDVAGTLTVYAAEPGAIGARDDDDAIRSRVLAALAKTPGTIGINNHQGSKATADARVVRAVLGVVKERGLFFLDSRTTNASVAGVEAEAMRVPFLARDVFLDDAATESADPGGAPGALETAWGRGIGLAKKRGQAILIGHPRPETLAFLSEKLKLLGKKDAPRAVRVSELVP